MKQEEFLNPELQNHWDVYVAAEKIRIRTVYLEALNRFLELIRQTDEAQYRDWVYQLCSEIVDEGDGFPIRIPLFEVAVFPVLYDGFLKQKTNCARWLAGFSQMIYKSKSITDKLGDCFSERYFLNCAINHDPNDVLAKQRLLKCKASYLDFTIHEVPWGVLWSNQGASIEQCGELLEELSEFKNLAEDIGEDKYSDLIDECDFHFKAYANYLSNRSEYKNYEHYLSLNPET